VQCKCSCTKNARRSTVKFEASLRSTPRAHKLHVCAAGAVTVTIADLRVQEPWFDKEVKELGWSDADLLLLPKSDFIAALVPPEGSRQERARAALLWTKLHAPNEGEMG
jgi:hypothetical protein